LELTEEIQPIPEGGCPLKRTLLMPRNPKKVWQYFAQAIIQEEDPEKISYLTERLFEALAEKNQQPKPNHPTSNNSSE
jgi:hypothetical protein